MKIKAFLVEMIFKKKLFIENPFKSDDGVHA